MLSFALFAALAAAHPSYAGNWTTTGDLVVFTATSTDAGAAHASANEFAKNIGANLKTGAKRVLDPHVDLHTYVDHGKTYYEIRWSVRLTDSSESERDCYFAREGTIFSGKTVGEAQKRVRAEIKKSQKVKKRVLKFKKVYKDARIPGGFVRSSFSGSATEGRFSYIEEYFILARTAQCR